MTLRDPASSFENKCDREDAKTAKEDAKGKTDFELILNFLNLLRVFLRALRAFAVAFVWCLIAQGYLA
jgi:hypothetical protein